MNINSIVRQRYTALFSAAVLMLAVAAPVILGGSKVYAGQVTARSIRITSSKVAQTGVIYNFSFNPNTITATGADDILGIVIQFCQNSPLVGIACTTTNGVSATPADAATVVVTSGSGVNFTVNAASNQADLTILTHATGIAAPSAATPITFAFTATNPTGTSAQAGDYGTFYARILTYNTEAGAAAYTDTAPGAHLDDGGVALSTAKQLTISARVQEQLEFCVAALDGTIDTNAEVPANCSAAPFANATATTAVDVGVVDSGVSSISPVAPTSGGNDKNGGVLIRTNAFGGATISYFAEQDTSSGRLKVAGATCTGTSAFDATSSEVDQCFNSSATQTSFAAAGEKFGMTALKYFNASTDNLTRDAAYDGDGTAAVGFAWDSSGTNNPATTLATSTTVLDYELLVLRFAARAAATTPTGAYTVTSTYIATATF